MECSSDFGPPHNNAVASVPHCCDVRDDIIPPSMTGDPSAPVAVPLVLVSYNTGRVCCLFMAMRSAMDVMLTHGCIGAPLKTALAGGAEVVVSLTNGTYVYSDLYRPPDGLRVVDMSQVASPLPLHIEIYSLLCVYLCV